MATIGITFKEGSGELDYTVLRDGDTVTEGTIKETGSKPLGDLKAGDIISCEGVTNKGGAVLVITGCTTDPATPTPLMDNISIDYLVQ